MSISALPAADFCRLGRLLHGEAWQQALAVELGVSVALVRAMARGSRAVQHGVLPLLRLLLLVKAARLRDAARELPRR